MQYVLALLLLVGVAAGLVLGAGKVGCGAGPGAGPGAGAESVEAASTQESYDARDVSEVPAGTVRIEGGKVLWQGRALGLQEAVDAASAHDGPITIDVADTALMGTVHKLKAGLDAAGVAWTDPRQR